MSVNERCPLSVRYLEGFFKGFVLILPGLLTFVRYLEVPLIRGLTVLIFFDSPTVAGSYLCFPSRTVIFKYLNLAKDLCKRK